MSPLSALRCSRLLLARAREVEGSLRYRSQSWLLCELPGPSFVWLLRPGLSLGPRAASCELDAFPAAVGVPVRCSASSLEIDGRVLSFLEADPWEPRWSGAAREPGTLSMPRPSGKLAPELARALEGGLADACSLVARLIGLGGGSTPAGDDLLLGLRVAWRLCRAPPLAALDQELRARARVGTVPIAAEMLLDAVEDLYPEAIHGVLEALTGGGSLASALVCLRGLGASSGHAMEWGIWLGLQTGVDDLSPGA